MKVIAIGQILLLLIAGCAHAVTCSTLYDNETDRLSLLEFKNAISLDPQRALISWNESTYFCNWDGVLCRVKTPHRVTSLNLSNRGLVGQISPSLGNLTFLRYLWLPANSFTGEIPPSIGHLHRLQTLRLINNTIQGRIPSLANCSSLELLELDGNQLVGQIPLNLPPNLQVLGLAVNNLTGTIPASVANLTQLYVFSCAANNIEGNIPNEFAKLPKLQFLIVSINSLAGRFQQSILNISTLLHLAMGKNDLRGDVPSSIGNNLPSLQLLQLDYNSFHGHIPPSLINASKLYQIDLSSNNFTGVIPGSIGRLSKLSLLNLEINNLETRDNQDWEFMNSLPNCTNLYALSVQENRLEGHIPSSLGNLSIQLQQLLLGENRLLGGFPPGIVYLPNLINVALDHNQFTGVIPEWLGALKSLQILYLSHNNFTGFIPSSLSNLSQLTVLYLQSNKFIGQLPSSFGNLQMLTTLNIYDNNLHGSIPKEIFGIPTIYEIILFSNNLDGELPDDIGNAKQLSYLLIASNKLSGHIPETLGNCESLEYIDLQSNILSGSIPTSLGNIRGLQFLYLSSNNFTGSIPMSLGDLQYLEQLNLTFNHLEGEVPTKGIFKNANATSVMIDGNQGLCGGAPELHLMACPIRLTNQTKHKPFLLLKVVIPVACMLSFAMVILVLLFWKRKQKRKDMKVPSFGKQFPKVSFIDLSRATEGFLTSNIVGRGRFGSVYQGKLFQDGNYVAIKVFNLDTRGAQESFTAECNTLRNVRHRNVVPILTACSSIDSNGNDFKALVYEFMPRGDLHILLYSTQEYESSSSFSHITLAQRLSIVVDVADAMEYIHHDNQGTIVHCDIKPSNILLDENMTAHVGDFGLARFKVGSTVSSSGGSLSTSSIAIKGTIGYVAPECAGGGQISTASDVYSFGIILLEIFLRKRPTDDMFKDGVGIAKYVEMNFPSGISEIVDPELLQYQPESPQETVVAIKEKGLNCLVSALNIGLCCTKLSPNERLNMHEVAARLHGIKEAYLKGN